MKSGQAGGVKWRINDEGSLCLEGEGNVSIDTESSGFTVQDKSVLKMCPSCKQWLEPAADGSLPHDAEQTVKCVLES